VERNTKHDRLYLEYAEQQNDAKHHHEELRADDCKVGDLDTCKEQKRVIIGSELTNIYLLICLLTYSMAKSPSSETNRLSASQVIPHILCNPKVHYRTHKCPQIAPILSQLDPVHTTTSHFLKIHHNITFPSTPGSPQWSLSFRFPYTKPCTRISPPPYALNVPPISFFSIL